MMRKMDMVYLHGQMEENKKGVGKRENNTVKVNMLLKMVNLKKEYGLVVSWIKKLLTD